MSCRSLWYACVLVLSAASGAVAQQPASADVIHLLSRATFGVRPSDVTRAQAMGASKWLDEQLHPDRIDDGAVTAKLNPLETLHMSIPELAEKYAPQKPNTPKDSAAAKPTGPNPRIILAQLVTAKLIRASESNRQLEEVMTDFWFNHFNVFWASGPVRYMVADYEANAIRPHVFGKFEDLLKATAQHPAMLLYLNNAMSAAPDTTSPFMRRIVRNVKRPLGLNENYARELMELHTLGVDGGYTQNDVTEVARAFTGWTITRPLYGERNPRARGTPGSFQFVPQLHDHGEKVVLGKRLPAGRGEEDGEEVLHMLARSPATAHFIARKLVEHFVSDAAPADFVDDLAAVFLKTDGDLRAVTRALFASPKFYDARYRRTKVKTPFELVASALRVTNTPVTFSPQLIQTLRTLGELPYGEQAPTGFPAASDDWVNSGAMLARMNFAIALAARARLDGDVDSVLAAVLPGVDVTRRRAQVLKDAPNDLTRALGYILGSPEFQVK